ncbi:MAG: hypothetical protein Aurels2KO_19800 [Aureliella sp.]
MSGTELEREEDLQRAPVLREHFIPMHCSDLVTYLGQHPALPEKKRAAFQQFSSLVLALLHHLYRQRHEHLTDVYAPLDPDCDRVLLSVPTDETRERACEQLAVRIEEAIGRANYHRLEESDIQRALQAASQWGVRMRVDFAAMKRMDVYARGCVIGQRRVRSWKTLFREKEVDVPLYQRLVVYFQTRSEDANPQFDPRKVYLRMFKNVPQQDVDMMLPSTGIQMSWIDHSRIVVPSVYAAAMTMWRFLRNVLLWTFFGVFKTLGLVILVILALGFGVKSMFTYRTATQRRYMLNMTQRLYYQNLDNNSGVLLRLLDEGEQQETSEIILCYFVVAFLMRDHESTTLKDIDEVCETLLQSATNIHVDFDVESTARNMFKLGLLTIDVSNWRAVPIEEAIQLLDATWDNWFDSSRPAE